MKTIKLLIITICIAMLCACSSSGGGGGNSSTNNTVSAIGGTGSNGSGGAGGEVYVESDGAIKVLKSGSADASFTMPAVSSYNLGSNGYTVSESEQILLDTTVPSGYKGLYMIDNKFHGTPSNWNLYKADGTGTANSPGGFGTSSPVTGLWVSSGATLTINADNNAYGGSYLGAYLTFDNDVIIDGTLTTGAGYNYIYFYNDNGDNPSSNNVVVTGTVTTSGANYGWIEFDAGKHFYNSGTIDASGGDNATGDGNTSYGIYIYAYTGSVYSKGTLKANGGNGGNGAGGDAYYGIYISGGDNEDNTVDPINGGSVIISGTVESKGGNAGGTTGGDGGSSGNGSEGYSDFEAYGGDMIVNASFNFIGGNGVGTGSTGGSPYGADFYCFGEDYRHLGVCQISGSFNVNGGNGETGGDAGYVEVYSWGYNYDNDEQIDASGQSPDVELLGFANINLSGGNGTTAGGNASDWAYELYAWPPWDDYDGYYTTAYPIISEANVTARGGNASAASGTGGTGGYADIETDKDNDYYNQTGISVTEMITQSGTIDVSGGNATASGGTGGAGGTIYLDYYGYDYTTTTTGILTAIGGNGALQGGNGGYIEIYSDVTDTVYTLANLSVTGGTGTTAGSSGKAYVDGVQKLP